MLSHSAQERTQPHTSLEWQLALLQSCSLPLSAVTMNPTHMPNYASCPCVQVPRHCMWTLKLVFKYQCKGEASVIHTVKTTQICYLVWFLCFCRFSFMENNLSCFFIAAVFLSLSLSFPVICLPLSLLFSLFLLFICLSYCLFLSLFPPFP